MDIVLDEQTALQRLIDSPRLPQITRQLDEIVSDEQARRQAFYDQITEDEKVEYINGKVIFQSPVKLRHNTSSNLLHRILSTYVSTYGLGVVGYEKLLISLTRNDYEPDLCFFTVEQAADFEPDQMQFPAPAFIVEVLSDSTEAKDRGIKYEDYAAHDVREYWVIDPMAETLEQFVLRDGEYELRMKSATGTVESLAVDGFSIPVRALFDDAVNRETLRQIVLQDF